MVGGQSLGDRGMSAGRRLGILGSHAQERVGYIISPLAMTVKALEPSINPKYHTATG